MKKAPLSAGVGTVVISPAATLTATQSALRCGMGEKEKLSITIVVPDEICEFFASAVVSGHGGYQTLCRMVAEKLQDTKVLRLTPSEFRRLVRYATHYGYGGFQAKFRAIVICWVDQNIDELLKGR